MDVAGYDDAEAGVELRRRLAEMYGVADDACFLTSTGRAAAFLLLRALQLPADSEVAVQAFTCVAAVVPILWAGITPVYVDVDPATLSMSLEGLSGRITTNTRLIVVQHTFGIPGPVGDVVAMARERDVRVLEDCAHALGARVGGRAVGTAGDAALLSFGVEKTLWTTYGGALIVNDPELIEPVARVHRELRRLSLSNTFEWLLYPGLHAALRRMPSPLRERARKAMLATRLLQREVTGAEMSGRMPAPGPGRLAGVFARLVLDAMSELDRNLAHRAELSLLYDHILDEGEMGWKPPLGNPALLRYAVVSESRERRMALGEVLERHGVSPSRWFDPAIFPRGVDTSAVRYDPAECPIAESIAGRIVNLPTGLHVTRGFAAELCRDLLAANAGFTTGARGVPAPR